MFEPINILDVIVRVFTMSHTHHWAKMFCLQGAPCVQNGISRSFP